MDPQEQHQETDETEVSRTWYRTPGYPVYGLDSNAVAPDMEHVWDTSASSSTSQQFKQSYPQQQEPSPSSTDQPAVYQQPAPPQATAPTEFYSGEVQPQFAPEYPVYNYGPPVLGPAMTPEERCQQLGIPYPEKGSGKPPARQDDRS